MYIDIVLNRNSRPAVLVREAWREGGKIRKRTCGNLTGLSDAQIQAMRQILKGKKLVDPEGVFTVQRSLPHGHVEAVLAVMRRLGLPSLIASQPSAQRDLVVAMIAQRLLDPCSKLASTRLWRTTTLGAELGVEHADVDELYDALDWLLQRQGRIEKKLARRHLAEGGRALYDVTSSYYEGRTCVLACWGRNCDGKEGTLWYYGELKAIFQELDSSPLAKEFVRVVNELDSAVGAEKI